MNEENNTALVRSAYEAFSRGDIATVLGTLADDVDWYVPGPRGLPMVGRWRGKDEVGKFFEIIAEVEEPETFQQNTFIAQGDNVIVLGHYRWRVKATGRIAECDYAHAFTLRNGKVATFHEYNDSALFAEAFGLIPASA